MICRYYYPQCTLLEILKELYIDLPIKINTGFRVSWCSTIKKRVFYYSYGYSNYLQTASTDEYGYFADWYITKL
jgi:hypothetical protein